MSMHSRLKSQATNHIKCLDTLFSNPLERFGECRPTEYLALFQQLPIGRECHIPIGIIEHELLSPALIKPIHPKQQATDQRLPFNLNQNVILFYSYLEPL